MILPWHHGWLLGFLMIKTKVQMKKVSGRLVKVYLNSLRFSHLCGVCTILLIGKYHQACLSLCQFLEDERFIELNGSQAEAILAQLC